jgi:DNA invertase Pin-like site-specific DNA recombinase/peptidoglycan hydrolase-like protein with peptidoglycan-binding domain
MQSTSRRLAARAALGALTALLVLLAGAVGVAGATEPPRLAIAAQPLAAGAGFGDPGEAERVRAVQRVLARRGWAPGPLDGLYGPATQAAVARFQAAAGLAPDGIVGRHTARALEQARAGLRRGAGYQTPNGSDRVRALQRRLAAAGHDPGPIDGRFGPRTEAALARLQHAARLTASGAVDRATRRVLARHGGQTGRPVAVELEQLGPRVLGSVTIRPLAAPAAPAGQAADGVGLWLAIAIAAAGLLAGLLCGALWSRGRARPQPAPTNQPADGSAQTPPPQPQPRRRQRLVAIGANTQQPPPQQQQQQEANSAQGGAHTGQNNQPQNSTTGRPDRAQSRPGPDYLSVPKTDGPQARAVGWRTHQAQPQHRLAAAPARRLEAVPPANPQPQPAAVRAVGYVSVPSTAAGDGGLLEAQAEAIGRLCARRGWELLHVVRDVENGHPKGMERPGLLYALERIAQGEASCLVVSELERLSRSAADLGRIVDWLDQRHGRLVAIDLRLDTGSAQGRLTARTLVAVGQWEGRRIAQQTKKGLAAARARRAATGRPAVEDIPALKQRIVDMRQAGMTLQAIADQLNQQNTPTLRGGREWRPSSVQAAAGYRRPKPKHNQPKRRKP